MNPADLNLNFAALAPAAILVSMAIIVMLVDAFTDEETESPFTWLTMLGVGAAGLAAMALSSATRTGFSGMLTHDALAAFGEVIVCAAALVTLLTGHRDLANHRMRKGEFYVLFLASLSGMALMMSASDLVMLFLGLELMSIPVYALAGFNRASARSGESAFKYFILGAFASALLLYGSALLYGATGSTEYSVIKAVLAEQGLTGSLYLSLGLVLVLAALAFKVSAVPFHMWTPDVYEGAPVTVTSFMSAAVKATAFIALARLLSFTFADASDVIYPLLWTLAAVTMVVGNVLAVVQSNLKRMLAYSSIAHAGYLLVALATGSEGAISAMLFYLLVYALSNAGAFAVMAAISRKGEDAEAIESWSGLASRHPVLAAAMALFMVSLAGIPPTAGFVGKFFIFKEAIDRGLVNLAVVGMIASAIGVYYYLRVLVAMYMREGIAGERPVLAGVPVQVGVALCSVGVVVFGVLPGRLLEIATRSIVGLF